jgi:HK97 gp10 family phage protein
MARAGGGRIAMVDGWESRLREPTMDLLARLGVDIADDARAVCPVDTGALKASIYTMMREDGEAVRVGADAKARGRDGAELDYTYSIYVELGTRYMSAEPFLRPALFRRRSG